MREREREMANDRAHRGPELARNKGMSPEAMEALLASTSSPDFHGLNCDLGFLFPLSIPLEGSSSMLNFEDLHQGPPRHSLFQHVDVEEAGNDDFDDCLHHPEKKRRLTSNQVQSLEKSFEEENKLEPERKIKLARDLGMQPRQVAIWFQNRRARWKTKQLEKDYESLKTNYDRLKDDYESITKEREKLKEEVLVLREKVVQKGMDDTMETFTVENNAHSDVQLQQLDTEPAIKEEKEHELPILTCNSANSVVFNPDSPHCTAEGGQYLVQMEPADSSYMLQELDPSDEENEKMHRFLDLVEEETCTFGFPVEVENGLWPWPC